LDISIRKEFRVSDRFHLQYAFNIYNVTNTTSMDVPQNGTQLGQNGSCANSFASTYNCAQGYEKYGTIITDQADQNGTVGFGPAGGGTAGSNLYQKPFTNGTSGKNTLVPTTLPLGVNGCSTATAVSSAGCANNGANFGSVTNTIGSQRLMTMDLHITF
jgi:hypothetical protein